MKENIIFQDLNFLLIVIQFLIVLFLKFKNKEKLGKDPR